MLAHPFPARLDNAYRGQTLALWVLGLVAAMKLVMGVNCMIQPAMVAVTADHIPLASYGPAGAQAVTAFFAVWGLSQALLALLAGLALIRYRTMVPIVFLLLLLEQIGRKLVFAQHPVVVASGDGGLSVASLINLGFLLALVLGLVLSLWVRTARAAG